MGGGASRRKHAESDDDSVVQEIEEIQKTGQGASKGSSSRRSGTARSQTQLVDSTVDIDSPTEETWEAASQARRKLRPSENPKFQAIKDKYETLEEVQDALRKAGLESSNLVVGIDFTKSNTWTGKDTFGGRCLHHIGADRLNPYQTVVSILGRTLEAFDDDHLIPCYGFGDIETGDRACFPFYPDRRPCAGFNEVLARYEAITPGICLSGPTNFAPVIHEAIEIVKETEQYHILVIVADGQVTKRRQTEEAIVEAAKYPLSIITVGVGDGPWDTMIDFDDGLPDREFDNFQFVEFHKTMMENPKFPEAGFALAALMEIPEQFIALQRLNLI